MNKSEKIFVSTSTFSKYDPRPLAILKRAGLTPKLNSVGRRLTRDELLTGLTGAIGMIAAPDKLDEGVFAAMPELRVISRVGTGLDSIDLKAAEKRGIQICSTADAPVDAVAELALTLMLNLSRQVTAADRTLRWTGWKSLMGNLLHDKTVGIVGLGRVGRRLAELLHPFRVSILATELKPDRPFAAKHKIRLVSLDHLLKAADIVSLHVNSEKGAKPLIGLTQLRRMKPSAILINTARGELIHEQALTKALLSGKIGGAGLDVFQTEPYKGPLLKCANTVLTCHMGTYAEETRNLMEIQAAENLVHALQRR